ncbi:hypothetical protein [Rufibacter aurantiacus]|nr:hypothetical protein [Rufibacter aurantiacus]
MVSCLDGFAQVQALGINGFLPVVAQHGAKLYLVTWATPDLKALHERCSG